MHSASPYILKSFNKNLPGKPDEKYSNLNQLGQYDLFYLLKSFTEARNTTYTILEETKQVYRFSNLKFDEKERLIYGWLQAGNYGIKSQIIDIETGEVSFEKLKNNADVINHFIYFYIPENEKEAISLFHSYRGTGIKTLFYSLFSEYFQRYTHQNLSMQPLAYEKAMNEWLNASTKEIRLLRYKPKNDIADQIKFGFDEQILTYKAPRRGTMGRLADYFEKGTDQHNAIVLLSEACEKIKTVVELGGKKRTFSIGKNYSTQLCEIEIPEEINNKDGNPDFQKVTEWCSSIVEEFKQAVY